MSSLLRRLAALAMSAGLVLLVAPGMGSSSTPAAAADSATGPQFGVQFHGMWNSYDDTERTLFLDQLAASGAEWIRLDVAWSMIQPTSRDSYDLRWGVPFVDRVITMATDRGLKPLVTLWMTPAWANGGAGDRVLPHDPADYARAAQWAADRWSEQVPAWEVWNEPNHDHFMKGADPVAYTRLLQAAAPAIHAGNPDAKVVFGGPSLNDTPWLERAYAAGAKGYFDVMATHPYQAVANLPPEAPDDGTIYRFTHLAAVHDLMVRNGDGDKPIWATEFGWSTHPNVGTEKNWELGVTEAEQGDFLVRSLRLVEAEMPYVTHLFWYTDRDFDDGNPQLSNYGMFYSDLRPKPMYFAIKDYLASRQPAPSPTPSPSPSPAPPPPPAPGTSPDVAVTLAGPTGGWTSDTGAYVAGVTSPASATGASTGLKVTAALPAGLTLEGVQTPPSSDWACALDTAGFVCLSSGDLLPGGSAPPITFSAVRDASATGSLTVSVVVESAGDSDDSNDQASHTSAS